MRKVVIPILIFLTTCLVSWFINCGIVKLITLCFGWSYKWSVATGVWLVMCLLNVGITKK